MDKQDDKANNPHDAFISKILRHKTDAISLIKGVLPEKIKNNIDYQSLRLSPDTYVSRQLQKTFTDIVYDGNYGTQNKSKIAFIIEHKSYNPKQNIKLQLLQYFIGVVNTQINQKINPRRYR